MADRTITTDFWTDSEDWTKDQRTVFLYLCTNPQAAICGLYKISINTIANATGCSVEEVRDVLRSLEVLNVAYYDSQLVFIRNYAKYQHADKLGGWHRHLVKTYESLYKSGNRAAEAFMGKFGDLLQAVLRGEHSSKGSKKTKGSERASESKIEPSSDSPTTLLDSNTDTDSLSNSNSNKKGGVGEKTESLPLAVEKSTQAVNPEGVPESEAVVVQWMAENGSTAPTVHARKFISYYEARGWLIDDKPVRNWRALAVNWVMREPDYSSSRAMPKQAQKPAAVTRNTSQSKPEPPGVPPERARQIMAESMPEFAKQLAGALRMPDP